MATPPLYQLFADQVTANPDVLALDGPGGAYTYQQLGQWSDLLSQERRQRGGGPGQLVGVGLERTWPDRRRSGSRPRHRPGAARSSTPRIEPI